MMDRMITVAQTGTESLTYLMDMNEHSIKCHNWNHCIQLVKEMHIAEMTKRVEEQLKVGPIQDEKESLGLVSCMVSCCVMSCYVMSCHVM